MENQSWAPRMMATLAYFVALLGAGSVFFDVWNGYFVPTPRTWMMLAVQVLLFVLGRGGTFLRTHISRALSVHLLAYLVWLLPWGIYLSVGSGLLQREWLQIRPYFVLLITVTLIAGLALPTYLIEAAQDALSGTVRESLRNRGSFWLRRR